MAGIIKVDRVQSDSNLAFNIAGANVAFMDASALRLVGSGITANGSTIVSGGRIVAAAQPTGAVLQVVSAAKVDVFSTTSTSGVDVTGLTVTLTPTSTTSKFYIIAQIGTGSTTGTGSYFNLVRNSTNLNVSTVGSTYNATTAAYTGALTTFVPVIISYLDSPSTASAVTYKIQAFSSAGSETVYVNRRGNDTIIGLTSSLTVMEIAG